MYEPSTPPPEPPKPSPEPQPPGGNRALRLLHDVRAAQARSLLTQGGIGAIVVFLIALTIGAWVGSVAPRAGLAVIIVGAVLALISLVVFGVVLPRLRVGDDERTARTLAELAPELNLDLLAAVELSKALGHREDFSPDLARAFLRDVDLRASKVTVATLIDPTPVKRAAMALVVTVFAVIALLTWKGATLRAGFAAALTPAEAEEPTRRQPITGDVELTFTYPPHTGLEPRTIPSTTGDISAPTGTEVTFRTRADRDVEGAALIMGAQRVPLTVEKKRQLQGRFVISESGVFHVAFLDGKDLVAEGPDQSITAEADQAPQVRLTAPVDGLELMPENQSVGLKFEASDDYGLTALDLVYTADGKDEPQRVSLRPDDGRTTRGTYQWDVTPLSLKAGQVVTYWLEATDNDGVKGKKVGSSARLTLRLYSSAEHRQEALKKAEALWQRLIDHLALRMESPDRASPTPVDAAVAAKGNDERGTQLAGDFTTLAGELQDQRDPPKELLAALLNISAELNRDVNDVTAVRRTFLRLSGREKAAPGKSAFVDSRDGSFTKDLGKRLAAAIATDIAHSEKNVLYLEALLDRARMDAMRELAQQLRRDRQELSRLVEEYSRTKDDKVQQALLEQMNALKQRMTELQQRMAELSKGIRDDFMNQEALQQMQEEFGMEDSLSEIEKLVKEGKGEEALKKMQELAMTIDDFLENLEKAQDESDQEQDPELNKQFQEFTQKLDETLQKQEQLADKTRALRDKARSQQKDRIAKQGEQLKKELKGKLDELEKSWSELDGQRMGYRFDDTRKEALQARDNVEQALEANDFDLASEAADAMEEAAREMADNAEQQRRNDELFQNPADARRESKQSADRLSRDAKKSQEVAQKLRDLFPQPGQQMSDGDKQQMNEMARQQRQLQQSAQDLAQRMEQIGERAPIFDEEAQQQMQQAGERMQGAGERLQGKDANKGFGEQQGAMQALRGVQQAMQQQGGKGGKGGLPMPAMSGGKRGGRGNQNQKVEIPDEDPNAGPREFRKDVMDAMKQGAPDKYKEQSRKYYEELVK
ncbi:MAG: DUF4175 domain-containing protein [Archangium gephyra]|uniref:DUF4175 domain-containing protein n=1 Tax=Archangium gephyra TaxID=48 RepID=A0A2W5T8F1_9BACT|nr:MAG: DUF4175 domain-containing protein [Archangium gephyra]